ncbi:MAG: hypothetical protein WA129_07295, partial [Acidovorax sp.]
AHCVVATRLCGIATRHSQRLALHPASARHKRDIGNFRIPYCATGKILDMPPAAFSLSAAGT